MPCFPHTSTRNQIIDNLDELINFASHVVAEETFHFPVNYTMRSGSKAGQVVPQRVLPINKGNIISMPFASNDVEQLHKFKRPRRANIIKYEVPLEGFSVPFSF